MKTTNILLTAALLAALALLPAQAADEGVYGPVAPPGSAFVRVFNATAQPELQARIGDKAMDEIAAFGASEFVFLPPGQYTLTVGAVSKPVALQANKFYTAALEGKELRLLDNERYTNRLKALVIVYNLVDGSTYSVKTPDGRPVVENIAPNSIGSREVNAVKVNLALFDGAKKVTDIKPMNLERGRAFSLFVAGDKNQPVTSWVVN
jgi:alginate O-acetyltransferase complex protein AlgF